MSRRARRRAVGPDGHRPLALRLLTRLLPAEHREFILGDVVEELAHRRAVRGAAAARRWLWAEVWRCATAPRPRPAAPAPDPLPEEAGAMRSLVADVHFALRQLLRNPGFAAVALLTLALGIGANSAIFTVVHAVLLEPLSYPHAERLVILQDVQPQYGLAPASWPELRDWQEEDGAFTAVAGYHNTGYTMTGRGEPLSLAGSAVTPELLPMLGVRPALGRGFTAAESTPGGDRVVMVSHGLWHRSFAADPGVLGQRIEIDGQPHTIVGVLPADFRGVLPRDVSSDVPRDLWLPLRLDEERAPRGLHFLTAIARLRPGVTLARAQQATDAYAEQLRESGGTTHGIAAEQLTEYASADARPIVLALAGAVGLVLLIACANLANLLLARAASRRQEIAVRLAAGAARGRLLRQLLTESVLLALLGAAAGLVIAALLLRVLSGLDVSWLAGASHLSLSPTVLLFTALLAVVTGLIFGLTPALQASRPDLREALKEGPRQSGGGARLRGLLVVAEVALSATLLVAAGLLARSFVELLHVELGFEPAQVTAIDLSLAQARYPEPADQARALGAIVDGVRGLPGVAEAALVNELPLGGGGVNGGTPIEGKTYAAPDEVPNAEKRMVTPGYFAALRIPVLRGRAFSDRDAAGAPGVAIVSQAYADKYLAGEDPIGRRVGFAWDLEGFQEIVGVVGNVPQYGLDDAPTPEIYVPLAQRPVPFGSLVVRSPVAPDALLAAVRRTIREVDPAQPVRRARTLDEVISSAVAERRLALLMVGAFALLALVLAAIGVYGVMSYSVLQRTPEIGLRMALGARRRAVVALILRQGMRLAVAGLCLGLVGAAAASRALETQLYQVAPGDPLTFLAVVVVLASVALLATWVPARRSAHVDPMVALRAR